MRHSLRRPCNDCPFLRTSTPAWLGSAPPEWFVSAALADHYEPGEAQGEAMPCHKTVDYQNEEWRDTLEDAEVCEGALVFYRNIDPFKLPRQEERADLVASVMPHHTVFATAEEFINHHDNAEAKSWLTKGAAHA